MANVNRIGFTQLLGGENARNGPYQINIVFVHGLRGHPKHTWEGDRAGSGETTVATSSKRGFNSLFRAKSSTRITDAKNGKWNSVSPRLFWPEEFLTQDIPEARVWTYGYEADVIGGLFQANNQNSVSQHGRDLKVRVERDIDNKNPIIFVAHSLGGVIVKDAMNKSETCRLRTKLIVFLGTPHRGSSYAGWGEIVANLARLVLQDSNKRILETLEVNSEVLDNIHEEFKTVVHKSGIKIHSFQETQGISGMKGLDNKVVDDFSSKLDLPRGLETVETINANHRQMARCGDRSDPQYRAILGVLKQEALSHLRGSFSSHMILRERPKIPYLTWLGWYNALTAIGQTWGADAQVGLARIGMYSESWMNLLMIFGAENILTSAFIRQLPVDEDDILRDIANPFAIDLGVLANLMGIIGCDELEYVGGLPVFTHNGARLEFARGGSNSWIGRFTQETGLPMHFSYDPRTLGRASLYAAGTITYGFGDAIPLVESLERQLLPQRLLRDLQHKALDGIPFNVNQYQGLRIPALALLAGDSPVTSRVFPTRSSRVLETTRELSSLCLFWSKKENRIVPRLKEYFRPAIGSIAAISRDEFRRMPFCGDRVESRVIALTKVRRDIVKFIDLGFSWLATHQDYTHEVASDRRIKARPEWPSVGDANFLVLDDALLACDIYLRCGDISLLYTPTTGKAYLDTCLSCQLQEVDWWLGTKQALAAYETFKLLNRMSSSGGSNPPYTEAGRALLVFFTERRVVCAILVFRAILIAVRLGLGLDNSDFNNTDLENKIVFLR